MSGSTTHHNENIVTIAGRVEGTGTVAVTAGTGFYATDRGTGLYGLTFPRSCYEKVLGFVATCETTDNVCVFDIADFTDSTVDITDGSTTAAKDSETLMVPGMAISGAGIPDNTYVASVTSTTAFELSNAATATTANITATLSALTEGDTNAVICVRTEAIDESAALVDADFSFVAVFQVSDGNS